MSQGEQQSAPEAPADIDALALQAEADQDVRIERDDAGEACDAQRAALLPGAGDSQ